MNEINYSILNTPINHKATDVEHSGMQVDDKTYYSFDYTPQYDEIFYQTALNAIIKTDFLLCGGNGGSFSDAEHFTAELIGQYNGIDLPFPALTMGSNGSELTSIANDYGYKNLFIPYIRGFYRIVKTIGLVLISTSGTSKNIIKAINYIEKNKYDIPIILLTGINKKRNHFSDYSHANVIVIEVFSENTQIIQEIHIQLLHRLAGDIKKLKFTCCS